MTLRPRLDRVTLVVNAHSRRGADALDHVQRGLRQVAGSLEVIPVTKGADLPDACEKAAQAEPDLFVIGGGDGSIGCAAGAVAGTTIALGVLPLGTANDFARTLEIPTAIDAAVRNLVEGHVVDIDLGRADGRPFLNVASAGMSVAVTRNLSPGLKRWLGPIAYVIAAAAAYRTFTPFDARLEFPDGDHPEMELTDLLQVAIGNGKHFGGGATISPTASLDDNLLDVHTVHRGKITELIDVAHGLSDGALVHHHLVDHVTTRRLRLHTNLEEPVNLDGEIVSSTPTLFEVQRNAVHVVVPQHSTAARYDPEDSEGRAPG
ncbi:MAG: lipid kinase [Actinomycetales bacterium]